jgi:hypothetical protein
MKAEYIIFGIIGVVILYMLSKLQSPEPQRVAEFVGSPTAQGSPDFAAREQGRQAAFSALANVAQTQTQADLTRYTTDAQLSATQIAADVQRTLGLEQTASTERMHATETGVRERLGMAGFDVQRFLAEIQERLGLKGLEVQQAVTEAGYDFQANLYAQDLANRMAQQQMQIAAIQSASQTYRNQSLERQGTILNALTSVFGTQQPYNYVSAFGGPRQPGFFSPGGAFSQLLGAGGRFLGNFGLGF